MTNEKLEQMLDELVRPALKAHGGDVASRTAFCVCGCWVSAPAVPPPP